MLNLHRLRLLRELDRRGTMAEVAQVLSYTPSTISQQLALLEREAGVPLFDHVGRRVVLTDAGRALVGHTEEILARLELAEADLEAGRDGMNGSIRAAAFPSVLATIAPAALSLLAERAPGLRVELHQREVEAAYDGLLAHEFDLIFGEAYPGSPEPRRTGVELADLRPDALRLAIPRQGPLSRVPESLRDLADAPWAFDEPTSRMGVWAKDLCRAAGFEPRVRFESPDPLLQAHLVSSGHAVAFIAELLAVSHLDAARLVRLPGDPHRMLFTAVRSGSARRPAILALRQALADAARDEAPNSPRARILG